MTANPSPPKTSTERSQALRQRRDALGLVQLNIYADKRDHAAIKAFAAQLTDKRLKAISLS